MELKNYQRQVIKDLSHYLALLNETKDISVAFNRFWKDKGIGVGFGGLPLYQNTMPGVPSLCAKVPTGGGKTLLACHAIRPIFDALPATKTKAVVWLVPSDAILTQTLAALSDTAHPYRQKINVDFGSRVEVYTKQQLLNGQNFNPTSVTEQLSIMVLSYDSFRGRKENLKARQENSSLAEFSKVLGAPENPIPDTDETALLQVINQLSPLVIVDESHHAKSTLSMEMLRNFNPCFILELTATPKKESNIFCYVDAAQLKRENMVKLPVIVYNRDSQTQVVTDAIDLRNRLEEYAVAERPISKRYIRPIVLFQAEPRGKEESTTFEKLRGKLIERGIPVNQIAIRTADVNELKGVMLTDENCPIRYIITVNALKEGWDCPFAYILASLANKTSRIDVEQILGRILRLPGTTQNQSPALNMSYVLTSSNDFKVTLDDIVRGLNSAGFSDRDCRVAEPEELAKPGPPRPAQLPISGTPKTDEPEGFLNFDSRPVDDNQGKNNADSMIAAAEQSGQAYDEAVNGQEDDPFMQGLSWEVQDKVPTFPINAAFVEEVQALRLPQFFLKIPETIFTQNQFELLEKEMLSEGFTLKGKSTEIDFVGTDTEMVMVDVRDKANTPKVFKMSTEDQQYFKEWFSHLPPKERVEKCKGLILHQLNKLNAVDAGELKKYVERVVDDMTEEQLAGLEKSPMAYAQKIREKIDSLLDEHNAKQFELWLETGKIVCRESYAMPMSIHPSRSTATLGKSLYSAEEEMNGLEHDLVMELTGRDNVRWWHRNIARQEFCINGFINHYPDIIIMTQKGYIIFVETKGEHLKNDDSRQKVRLGRAWQNKAGDRYRYHMVFRDTDTLIDGVYGMTQFFNILNGL